MAAAEKTTALEPIVLPEVLPASIVPGEDLPPEPPWNRNKGGRPPIRISLDEVYKLARLHPTVEEAASWFGVTAASMYQRLQQPAFRGAWERGRENGKLSLRRMQLRRASEGNTAMLIWLGKQMLGQADAPGTLKVASESNTKISVRIEMVQIEGEAA